MAKDRIDRNELADKLVESASAAEDPLRAMAEILTDFLMEAEVTAKIGAAPHERSEERSTPERASGAAVGHALGNDDAERAKTSRGRICAKFHRAS
jgi:hypothetical protein